MKNKMSYVVSAILCSSLCLSLAAEENTPSKKLFMEKYVENKSEALSAGKEVVKQQDRKRMSDGVDLSQIAIRDRNNSSFDTNLTVSDETKKKAEAIADSINKQVRSDNFKTEVNQYKNYILNDEELNLKKKMGKHADYAQDILNNKTEGALYQNKYLAHDERLVIAISSSMPEQTIKNYMSSLSGVDTDVLFVLNGFINNDPTKAMPTMKFVKKLLTKKEGTSTEKEETYSFRVDINPKMFNKYQIEKVPAVIFVKNYNPYSEIQGNVESNELNGLSNENVFISYGDSSVKHVLGKINRKAKSATLEKLIKNINKGFFDE